ncbi:MAG: glycosyltransferase [Gemmatimonadales bacterium]
MIEEMLGGVGAAVWGYAYLGYPAALAMLARHRPDRGPLRPRSGDWPMITVIIPVFNGEATIRSTIDSVLAADYPAARRRILVVSDASTDGTDAIAASYAARNVIVLRLPVRSGKTAAENVAGTRLVGDVAVNVDATIRVHPQALKRLVEAFDDPTVGVASGRDVTIGFNGPTKGGGEVAYVNYEMWVRKLETDVDGIIGASGCLFAMRSSLRRAVVPAHLSWDFAAVLLARQQGFRAVFVPDAICHVPVGGSLRQEYRRKVRTMARGLATLHHYRRLLDPRGHGRFAWMLASHKLVRWLTPVAALVLGAAVLLAAPDHLWARWGLMAILIGLVLATSGWSWRGRKRPPRLFAFPAFGAMSIVAGLHAWWLVLTGRTSPVWEPTRRSVAPASGGEGATSRPATPA